jgi:hypothetical protein
MAPILNTATGITLKPLPADLQKLWNDISRVDADTVLSVLEQAGDPSTLFRQGQVREPKKLSDGSTGNRTMLVGR